jgi:uncharacterized protein YnzC (UPF0291/DUF896 family)
MFPNLYSNRRAHNNYLFNNQHNVVNSLFGQPTTTTTRMQKKINTNTQTTKLFTDEFFNNNKLYKKYLAQSKTEILKSIPAVSVQDMVIGQYDVYNHNLHDYKSHIKACKSNYNHYISNTTTYAAYIMYINTSEYAHIPILVSAGKGLDEHLCQIRLHLQLPNDSTNNNVIVNLIRSLRSNQENQKIDTSSVTPTSVLTDICGRSSNSNDVMFGGCEVIIRIQPDPVSSQLL